MREFVITYKDASTQTVCADRYAIEGGWIVFYGDGGQVHSVPAADVKSISQPGVEDRKEASPVVA